MKLLIYILPFLTFAQSDGISHAQFTQQLGNMTHDLSIVNDCEASEKFRFKRDTINMNFHKLELFNTEIIVKKIINRGEIFLRCGSVVFEISENQEKPIAENNSLTHKIIKQ